LCSGEELVILVVIHFGMHSGDFLVTKCVEKNFFGENVAKSYDFESKDEDYDCHLHNLPALHEVAE